ncbi:MAG: hypothetical protein ACLQFW_11540 [Xanthobacteraceae bacterium]
MREEFTPWQRAALAHPHDAEKGPDQACVYVSWKGLGVVLTCDIDEETAQVFGGPVWHVSVSPPSRARAEALLSNIGEGELFEKPGERPEILHLRRRMTTDEMKLLGGDES